MAETGDDSRIESVREKIRAFPTGCGLYFFKGDGDKVLYIGKAKNLRSRAGSYFQQSADLVSSRSPMIAEMAARVVDAEYLETETEVDAMLQEARLIKDIRPPYNTDLVDDKTFPYLQITTGEDFPGIYITRKPQSKGVRLFGPFAHVKDLRAVLVELQKIFKFRTCNLDISADDDKRRFFRPCLLHSIKQCTAPCGDRISREDYRRIITDFIRFLKSKRSVILRQLKKQMAEASEKFEYERAAVFRDRIRLIERLDSRGIPDEHIQPEVFASDPTEALVRLRKVVGAEQPVRIIEGIDIANISGAEAVGSLVKFIDGRPFKSGYRRFRIKSVKGIDDYAMIAEVVRRRYKYALRGEELWPDLILIDGGLGHLHAAEAALQQMVSEQQKMLGAGEPADAPAAIPATTTLASIAKKHEDVYLQGRTEPLKLGPNSPARKLLQYVRDEAHRFAQHYHHILRSKKVLGQ